ncbi:hypothetical protein R1sor_015077 [Riccia sorocarpa]|uniref:Uncharacterized protein n=1 Tax=Riccia sorocarpa TaxID=122646 RepID=A0ABD3HBI7_9MARC
MEFYECRYRWADDLCNVGRSKGRSSRMDGDATIEAQEIMLTICSEAEKELVEGLKVSSAEEQRLRMRNVYGKICEMRFYLYQTVDELGWLVERTSKGKEPASNHVGSEKRNCSHTGTSNPPSTNVSCSVETMDIDNSPHGGWYSQGDRRDSDASSWRCALHRAQEASED